MEESRKEAFVNVLASLIVVSLLLAAAFGLSSLVPESESQSAIAIVPNDPTAGQEQALPSNPGNSVTGSTEESEINDPLRPIWKKCGGSFKNIHFACKQLAVPDKTKALEQPCSKGFLYTITIRDKAVTVIPQTLQAPSCEVVPPKCSNGEPASASMSSQEGQVKYCLYAAIDPSKAGKEGCSKPITCTGANLSSAATESAHNEALANLAGQLDKPLTPEQLQDVIKNPQNQHLAYKSGQNVLDAFKEAQTNLGDKLVAAEERIDYLDEQIKARAGLSPETPALRSILEEKDLTEQQIQDLKKQMDSLASNVTQVKPTLTQCGSEVCVGGEIGDERFKPIKDTTNQQQTGFTPPGGLDEILNNGLQKILGNGLQGGFGDILKKLLGGLGGQSGGSSGGQSGGNPQNHGACNPEQRCTGNTLVSKNNQCVEQIIQQCYYGCAPDGKTCATSPQTPPTVGAPTAELSCQPKTADVGMIETITWGCSAGTSTGSGFATNGARTGTATTTLEKAEPLASASRLYTKTFSLVCTNQGLTGTASCSVQVAQPWVSLVANPDEVDSGEKTAIGWVTAGMKENGCVISSPNQPDFTDREKDTPRSSGVAESLPITANTQFVLTCTTVGGNTRTASTTVLIKTGAQ